MVCIYHPYVFFILTANNPKMKYYCCPYPIIRWFHLGIIYFKIYKYGYKFKVLLLWKKKDMKKWYKNSYLEKISKREAFFFWDYIHKKRIYQINSPKFFAVQKLITRTRVNPQKIITQWTQQPTPTPKNQIIRTRELQNFELMKSVLELKCRMLSLYLYNKETNLS